MEKVIIALTAIIAMASCKKENVTPAPIPEVTKSLTKVINIWDISAPETETYTYDAQGKVTEVKRDSRTYTFNYLSASSLIVSERNNSDNSLKQTLECTLNANGNITKMIFKNPAGVVTYTYDYTYNAEGFITNRKGTLPGGSNQELVYTISNGNVIADKLYVDNVLNTNRESTYNNSKINKAPFGHAAYWQVYNLFGKASKNLLIQSKTTNVSGALTWHSQYTYEMDTDGYPVKRITNSVLDGKQGVETFTFQ